MQETGPVLSVVIPHLNQPDELEACLASLDAQSLDRALFEVVVVDNGSRSLPNAVIARHPGTRLAQEFLAGPGNARNRGVAEAVGDVLVFVDADCRAAPNWLRNALAALEMAPDRTILGGDVQIWRNDRATFSALEAYESVFAYRFKMYIEQHGFSGTGNLVVRRKDFNLIGPFKGIQVAEDIEWGRRALAAGYTFRFAPEVVVYHPARKSLRELCVKWDRHIQHAVNSARGKPMWRLRWIGRAIAVLGSSAVDWTKVVTSDRIRGVWPRLKAIFVLVSIRTYRAWSMVVLSLLHREVIWNRENSIGEPDAH